MVSRESYLARVSIHALRRIYVCRGQINLHRQSLQYWTIILLAVCGRFIWHSSASAVFETVFMSIQKDLPRAKVNCSPGSILCDYQSRIAPGRLRQGSQSQFRITDWIFADQNSQAWQAERALPPALLPLPRLLRSAVQQYTVGRRTSAPPAAGMSPGPTRPKSA